MFDLEQSIADWRQQMLAAGIKTPCRWRSWKIICATKSSGGCALARAINGLLKLLFNKSARLERSTRNSKKTESTVMKQIAKIGAGIIGVLVGMAFIMPAAAQCRHEGVMTKDEVVLYTFGMAICFAGAWLALHSIKKRKA
jgi:hypothetical protein